MEEAWRPGIDRPVHAKRHCPQLTKPRSQYGCVVLLRRAIGLCHSSRVWAASKRSWLTIVGTVIGIHSSDGLPRRLIPRPTGCKGDQRLEAGMVRVLPL
jgi:hypothetical protein